VDQTTKDNASEIARPLAVVDYGMVTQMKRRKLDSLINIIPFAVVNNMHISHFKILIIITPERLTRINLLQYLRTQRRSWVLGAPFSGSLWFAMPSQ
jgi:hypothetical protein